MKYKKANFQSLQRLSDSHTIYELYEPTTHLLLDKNEKWTIFILKLDF